MASLLQVLIILSSLMILPLARAQSPDEGAPGAKPSNESQVISANGFTCTQVESGVICKGAFNELDKNLILSASGNQMVDISAQKKDKTYSYQSTTGCLCVASKSSKKCSNQEGKSKTFKGNTMVQDATSFCTGGKEK